MEPFIMKYFEDFEIGKMIFGTDEYQVTREEILEFGHRWDPAPFHTDEKVARDTVFGGLIAPGAYIMAIQTWLVHHYEEREGIFAAAIGRVATDDLRFHSPVRPGDRICFEMECVEKRESRSNPDRGIITEAMTLKNQHGESVMTLKNTILVGKKPH